MDMKNRVLLATGLAVVLVCIFPPHYANLEIDDEQFEAPLGYYPIFAPPSKEKCSEAIFGSTNDESNRYQRRLRSSARIDVTRLIIQLFAVVVVSFISYLLVSSTTTRKT